MAPRRDYYEILGLDRSATQDAIKRAFRRLARRYHPDFNPDDPESEARFKEMAEAYAVLGDPGQRAQYDQYGQARPGPVMAGDIWEELAGFGDLFEAFFGTARGGRRARPRRGSDLRYDVQITLEEVAGGIQKLITAERLQTCASCGGTGSKSQSGRQPCARCRGTGQTQHTTATPFGRLSTATTCETCRGQGTVVTDPCPECGGQGRRVGQGKMTVTIPSGVEDGVSLRLEGEGEAGETGAPSGDLYVFVHVEPHEIFERRGRDLYCEIPVAFPTAALGGTVPIPTLGGADKLSIPAGTQGGAVFTVARKGLPDVRTGVPGQQYVRVRVVTPKKLTARQSELLAEFAGEGGDQIEDEKGWIERLREALRGDDQP